MAWKSKTEKDIISSFLALITTKTDSRYKITTVTTRTIATTTTTLIITTATIWIIMILNKWSNSYEIFKYRNR